MEADSTTGVAPGEHVRLYTSASDRRIIGKEIYLEFGFIMIDLIVE